MKKTLITISTFILLTAPLYGQERTEKSFFHEIADSIRISLYSKYAYHTPNASNELIPPYHLSAYRQAGMKTILYTPTPLNDASYIHGVFSSKLSLSTSILKFIKLRGSLYLEHRGFSFGVVNTNVISIIPTFSISLDTSLVILNEKFLFGIEVGNFENIKLNEGIFIYNTDAQGGLIYVGWNQFKLSLTIHADYIQWIGLNLGDLGMISLSTNNIALDKSTLLNASLSTYAMFNGAKIYYSQEKLTIPNFIAKYNLDGLFYSASLSISRNSFLFYGEYALRHPRVVFSIDVMSTLVVGVKYLLTSSKLSLNTSFEYRYSGWVAHAGFKDARIRYSPPAGGINFSQLASLVYPTSWYDRPFSQWAIITDFQGRNVYAGTLYATGRYFFYDSFFTSWILDVNIVKASNLPILFYPFFTVGLGWEPVQNIQFVIYATNKEMNYYRHFPTLSMMEAPFVGISLSANLDFFLVSNHNK